MNLAWELREAIHSMEHLLLRFPNRGRAKTISHAEAIREKLSDAESDDWERASKRALYGITALALILESKSAKQWPPSGEEIELEDHFLLGLTLNRERAQHAKAFQEAASKELHDNPQNEYVWALAQAFSLFSNARNFSAEVAQQLSLVAEGSIRAFSAGLPSLGKRR